MSLICVAKNKVTGLYFGKACLDNAGTGFHYNRSDFHVEVLSSSEASVVKATYDNAEFEPFGHVEERELVIIENLNKKL